MSDKTNQEQGNKFAEMLFEILTKIIIGTATTVFQGMRLMIACWDLTLPYLVAGFIIGFIFCYQTDLWPVQMFYKIFEGPIAASMMKFMFSMPRSTNFMIFICTSVGIGAFCVGLPRTTKLKKMQNSLDLSGFKNVKGNKPIIIDYYTLNDGRECVLVSSRGVGVDQYEAKIVGLSSSFGRTIDEFRIDKGCVSNVEIIFEGMPITRMCSFESLKSSLTKPNTFPVGMSRQGPVLQDITELPHMLIAGTTGGGKSVFLNSVILGLLHSTTNIRFYLLDLKKGIEAAPYKNISNVKIAKNETEAVKYLKIIVKEMNDRLEMMFEKDYNCYKDIKDKYDVIVVSVDEASVLYGKNAGGSAYKELIDEARQLTDQIAKLARACGIHLILATQKVSRETIDTKIRENLLGKMCFKMATISGSSTVLGNKLAYSLPAVPGRGIWTSGNNFVEVQAPYISRDKLRSDLERFKSNNDDSVQEDNKNEPEENNDQDQDWHE